MTANTIIVTRTLDAREAEALRRALRELWPGEDWTIMHGQVLRDSWGPSEHKMDVSLDGPGDNTTLTPLPRWET